MNILENEIKKVLSKNTWLIESIVDEMIKKKMLDISRRLTSIEAAKFLNISVKTLDNKCSAGEITYFKVGKKREFEYKDLKDYKKKKENIYPSLN